VTGGERCDPEVLALLLLATTGSELLSPVVLVVELVELAIRKPRTKKQTNKNRTSFFYPLSAGQNKS
jgi:hypothetical protein